ncbi:hypothetical protein EI555_013397 [Monodon monoceros]|uniref:Uncharacterized protein n=1 Tax=Monodon monoceros TaxID=40151 RepID=A0A4U1F118_MONMO|nr:hypothetical protein EI555_013397 [Monodon monoceros]
MSFYVPEYLNGTALRQVPEMLVIAMELVSSQLAPDSSFSFYALTPDCWAREQTDVARIEVLASEHRSHVRGQEHVYSETCPGAIWDPVC